MQTKFEFKLNLIQDEESGFTTFAPNRISNRELSNSVVIIHRERPNVETKLRLFDANSSGNFAAQLANISQIMIAKLEDTRPYQSLQFTIIFSPACAPEYMHISWTVLLRREISN